MGIGSNLEQAADALRLPPWDATIEHLSGGEKRRVALCQLLLQNLTCYCSTNPPTIWMPNQWLGLSTSWSILKAMRLPSHTIVTLDNAAGWILELDRGRGIPFEGNYSTWL